MPVCKDLLQALVGQVKANHDTCCIFELTPFDKDEVFLEDSSWLFRIWVLIFTCWLILLLFFLAPSARYPVECEVFAVIFIAEMVIKLIALGLIWGPVTQESVVSEMGDERL